MLNTHKITPSIKIKHQLMDFEKPKVMGILNITQDSFYDGGTNLEKTALQDKIGCMLEGGADILDVGAYSSRPGALVIDQEKEQDGVLWALEIIKALSNNVIVSVDTFRASVAKAAVDAGAHIINDISGGKLDAQMFDTVAKCSVPYILMHMRGNPQTMQSMCEYENLVVDVCKELCESVTLLNSKGVKDIIVDPGFGFAKTLEQNYELLRSLSHLQSLDCPILVGVSRKSMIYKLLNITPKEALNGTTALHMLALESGANILRVHDVKAAKEVCKIYDAYHNF